MSEDLLTTVQKALDKSDEWRGSFLDWPKYPPPDGAFELHSVDDIKAWLRALVAEVERLEFCRTKEHEAFLIVSDDLRTAKSALAALRLRHFALQLAIVAALNSPCTMGAEDIDTLTNALEVDRDAR